MQTVLVVFGTRPEAIKLAPVIAELRRRGERFRTVVCATGQHRQMLQPLVELFDLRPEIELEVMHPGQSLASLTARLLTRLDATIAQVRPDWLLAQGDTTTAMAAALAAFYRDTRFGHVEAGLRTTNRRSPFPEEINRRIADLLADRYFAPTACAREALLGEGVPRQLIHVTGNTVIDALLEVIDRPFDWQASPLARMDPAAPLVLVTAHRRESFGPPLREICRAVAQLALRFAPQGLQFVFPVHLNPEVATTVHAELQDVAGVQLLEPLDYLTTIQVMKRSLLILTDSGGIQEEAPTLRVPVLVLRETTERPEGIASGVARLVGTDTKKIVAAASELISDPEARRAMTTANNPYGDGQAARRIVDLLSGA